MSYLYRVVFANHDYSESFLLRHDEKYTQKQIDDIVIKAIITTMENNDRILEHTIFKSDDPEKLLRYSTLMDIDIDEVLEELYVHGFSNGEPPIEKTVWFNEDNPDNKKFNKFYKERTKKFKKLAEGYGVEL